VNPRGIFRAGSTPELSEGIQHTRQGREPSSPAYTLGRTPSSHNSPVGYRYTLLSTEKTANPESSFHGHQQDKIGEGRLRDNQRLVNLGDWDSPEGRRWTQHLDDLKEHRDRLLAAARTPGAKSELFEQFAGPRNDRFRPGGS
jgi:hypothetical protein